MTSEEKRKLRGIIALIGLFFGTPITIKAALDLRGAMRSETWPAVPGVITTSDLIRSSHDSGITPRVRYSYQVNGVPYEHDRMRYAFWTTERSSREIVNRLRVGQAIEVFVDPSNPQRSVLVRGGVRMAWIELVTGLVLFSGWVRAVILQRRERAASLQPMAAE